MHSAPRHARRAFTLVEILIATTILGIATVGLISVLFQGMKMYYRDRASIIINRDLRSLTSQMDTDAVTSNFFELYADFSTRLDGSGNDASLRNGQVGDMVVFVFTDPSPTVAGASMITRLVGYYREILDPKLNTGPVHRFDIAIPSPYIDANSISIGALLNQKLGGTAASYPIVTQLAQGLAAGSGTATPKLFYNIWDRSVMVNAQISESLNEQQTSTSRMGNTYNFTISPRG